MPIFWVYSICLECKGFDPRFTHSCTYGVFFSMVFCFLGSFGRRRPHSLPKFKREKSLNLTQYEILPPWALLQRYRSFISNVSIWWIFFKSNKETTPFIHINGLRKSNLVTLVDTRGSTWITEDHIRSLIENDLH